MAKGSGTKTNEAPVRAARTGQRGPVGQSVRAEAKYIRTSSYKVREVLDQIRGHDVVEAANILRFCPRDAAITIGKVLRSAVANAEHNEEIPLNELYVSACFADEGPTIKRFSPRARGRAGKILKRTSHITVIVSRKPSSLLAEAREQTAAVAAQRARRTAGQRAAAEKAVTESRREATGTEEIVAGATLADEVVDTAAPVVEAPADEVVEAAAAEVVEAPAAEATDAVETAADSTENSEK